MKNYIKEYSLMGDAYKAAVDIWSRDLHFPDYISRCSQGEIEPLTRKMFLKVKKDCQKQFDVNMKVANEKRIPC